MEVSDSTETAVEVERRGNCGAAEAATEPSLEGNGGAGGRRLFASAF